MSRVMLLIGLSSCSFALSGPDPLRAARVRPTCDSGKGLVAFDSVLAGGLATSALAIEGSGGGTAAIAPALLAAVFLGSALRGNRVVEDCRTAQVAYASEAEPPLDDRSASAPVAREPAAPVVELPVVTPAIPPPPPAPARGDRWAAFWKVLP